MKYLNDDLVLAMDKDRNLLIGYFVDDEFLVVNNPTPFIVSSEHLREIEVAELKHVRDDVHPVNRYDELRGCKNTLAFVRSFNDLVRYGKLHKVLKNEKDEDTVSDQEVSALSEFFNKTVSATKFKPNVAKIRQAQRELFNEIKVNKSTR